LRKGLLGVNWLPKKTTPSQMGYGYEMKRKTVLIVSISLFLVPISGCSSSDSDEKATKDFTEAVEEIFGPSDTSSSVTVVESEAREWPSKFCSLEIGATREQVRNIMGEPTLSFRDQNANQDKYEAWGYDLTIFYDINDKASQIQANTDNVPCDTKFSK
jgi:hypothetical protein